MRKISFTAFLIPFLILLLSFRLVVFDEDFYRSEFEKYGVYDRFDKEVADSAVDSLIDYMKFGVPLSDFFNEKEKTHMVDVKNMVRNLLFLLYMLFFVVGIAFIYNKKVFLKSLLYGGVFTLVLLLLFFIFSYTLFDTVFYKFHELSFSNDLWKLDPEVDNLKALLPDGFFFDALMRIFFISSAFSVILVIIGFSGRKVLNILKQYF